MQTSQTANGIGYLTNPLTHAEVQQILDFNGTVSESVAVNYRDAIEYGFEQFKETVSYALLGSSALDDFEYELVDIIDENKAVFFITGTIKPDMMDVAGIVDAVYEDDEIAVATMPLSSGKFWHILYIVGSDTSVGYITIKEDAPCGDWWKDEHSSFFAMTEREAQDFLDGRSVVDTQPGGIGGGLPVLVAAEDQEPAMGGRYIEAEVDICRQVCSLDDLGYDGYVLVSATRN